MQSELVLYHNKIRKNPSSFIPILEKWLKKYKENYLQLQNENPLWIFEGKNWFEDAIKFLKNQKPVPELKYNKELSKAELFIQLI